MKYLKPELEVVLFDVSVLTLDQTLVSGGTGDGERDDEIINPNSLQ